MEFNEFIQMIKNAKNDNSIAFEGASIRHSKNVDKISEGIAYLVGGYTRINGFEITIGCWSVVSEDHKTIADIIYDTPSTFTIFCRHPNGEYTVFTEEKQINLTLEYLPCINPMNISLEIAMCLQRHMLGIALSEVATLMVNATGLVSGLQKVAENSKLNTKIPLKLPSGESTMLNDAVSELPNFVGVTLSKLNFEVHISANLQIPNTDIISNDKDLNVPIYGNKC